MNRRDFMKTAPAVAALPLAAGTPAPKTTPPTGPATTFRMTDFVPHGTIGNIRTCMIAPTGRRPGCRGISPGFWVSYLAYDYVPTREEEQAGLQISFQKHSIRPLFLMPEPVPETDLAYESLQNVDFTLPLQRVLKMERALLYAYGEEAAREARNGVLVTHVRIGPAFDEMTKSLFAAVGPGEVQLTWRDMVVRPYTVDIDPVPFGQRLCSAPYLPLDEKRAVATSV